jgi:hypothetical protein
VVHHLNLTLPALSKRRLSGDADEDACDEDEHSAHLNSFALRPRVVPGVGIASKTEATLRPTVE